MIAFFTWLASLTGQTFVKWLVGSLASFGVATYFKSRFPNISWFSILLIFLIIFQIVIAIWFLRFLHSFLYGPSKGLLEN